ncbi:hypothetical protein [Kitasatospora sp. LaBMicrA B282]|uniref:hypothetical protein n=1 Tax=Kitasatospora sp. LaBMicrA B282 TaxID=3420949 RepID=UPI003D096F27
MVIDGLDGEPDGLGAAVAGVWAAETAQQVARALAWNNSRYPMAAVRFFRGAIRWRFPVPCDPREVSRALAAWVAQLPPGVGERLALREAEAFIRAEVNGEISLVAEVPIDCLPVRSALMVVTRFSFEEAVVSPAAFADLRQITMRAAGEHSELAILTDLKLDRIFVGRDVSRAEFEAMVEEVDSVRWT